MRYRFEVDYRKNIDTAMCDSFEVDYIGET